MFTEVPHARAGEQESGHWEVACWGTTETHQRASTTCFPSLPMLSGKKNPTLSAGKEGALWQCTVQARIKALIPGTESHSSSSIPLAPSTDKVIYCAVCEKGRCLQTSRSRIKKLGKEGRFGGPRQYVDNGHSVLTRVSHDNCETKEL